MVVMTRQGGNIIRDKSPSVKRGYSEVAKVHLQMEKCLFSLPLVEGGSQER